jgi:hypothetical protein
MKKKKIKTLGIGEQMQINHFDIKKAIEKTRNDLIKR